MNTTLNAVDGRLFLGREQRDALLDPEAKTSLATMERNMVQPGWAEMQVDKHTSAIWLAARLNRPESEVRDNFDHFASSYFGRAMTPGAVYDEIVKYEADQAALLTPSAPAGGVAQRGQAGAVEGEAPAKKGLQFVRTFGAAFEQGGQDAAAGTFSMIEGALNTLGGTPKRTSPFTDPKFLDSYEQLRELERNGLGETPEAERLRTETGAAVKAADADFLARKAEFENGTVRGALSSTAREHADFFFELSGAAMDRYGVDEAYRDTMFGKAAEMGGQMLSTSALMAAGNLTTAAKLGKLATMGQRLAKIGVQVAVNTAGTGQIYAGVTQERKAFQGEGYANEGWSFAQDLTDAGVQQAIEMVPFLDNAFEKALRHAPSRGGRVSLGEALKRFPMIAVHSGGVEAVEEVTQGAWHDFIVDQGYNDEMVDISNGKMDWAKRRGVEALAAFAGGVMMAGAMHVPTSIDQNRAAKRAGRLLTAKDGGLFTARDFQLLRDARSDAEIQGMPLGDVLLRAANGDAAAMKEYNKEAAKQAFKQVDGLALADGKLGEVDGKPAFLRDNGDIVVVDLTDAAQAAEWERVKEKALVWKEAQAMQGPDGARATSDMVDYIRQLQVERGGLFTIEANAKIETVLESVKGNRAKAQALINGYIQAGALPAGSTIENVAAPMGASDTKFDQKTRKFVTSIRIAQGANPLVVLEESAHDYFKRQIELGQFTESTVHDWRRQVEAGWEGKMNYTELHEWLAKYAVGYAMGKVQAAEASVLPASFRRYLERFAKFFRESLEFAAKVMQMERDNVLPGDFLRALQEATGLDEARARRRHTQAELSAVFANLSPESEVLANTAAQALADFEKLKEGYRAEIRAAEDAQNNLEARHEKAVAAGFMERQRAIDFAKAKLEEALQALADNQLAGDETVNVDGLTNEEEFVAELLAAVPVYDLDVQLSKQAEAVLMEYDQETEGSLSAEVRAERKAQRAENAANAAQAAARVAEMTGEDDNLTEAEAATLPSITAGADGGFLVKSPDGVEVGKAADIEAARKLALNWMDRQAREEERAQVMEDIGWGDDTELMAVVRKLGGIRAISTERSDSVFGGELAAIADNLSFADRIRTFRKNGMELDRLREALGEEGFEFETVTDMLAALEDSTRGNPVYPNRTQGGTTFSLAEVETALDALVRDDLEDDQVFGRELPANDVAGINYETDLGTRRMEMQVYIRGEGVKDFGPHEFFFYKDDGEPIGFARLTKSKSEASISMIAFKEEYRGQGRGRAFYEYLLDDVGVSIKSDKEITEGTAALYKSLVASGYPAKVDDAGRVIVEPKKAESGTMSFNLSPEGVQVPSKFRLEKSIKGDGGTAIIGYEWRHQIGDKWSNREGALVTGKVSDWDRAEISTGTGRQIVHIFYVRNKEGKVTIEGIGSAQNILGITQARLRSIAAVEAEVQRNRIKQEADESKRYEYVAKATEAEALADFKQRNFKHESDAFAESWIKKHGLTLFEKGGKFVYRPFSFDSEDMMVRNGWNIPGVKRKDVSSGPAGEQMGFTFSLVSTAGGGLLAVHNTTEDKLRKMEELGGLAAPSIAIIKPAVSDYTSFGDISLIAPPSLIDPKGGQKAKVFNADVYSPRFPRISYRVDETAVKAANKKLQAGYDALGGKQAGDLGVSEIQTDGLKAVSDVSAVKWTFLKEEGIDVDPVMRVSQPVPEALKRFELTDTSSKWALYENEEFQKAVGDYYKEDLKDMPELIVEYVREESGLGRRRPVEDMADRIMAAKKPEIDSFRTRRALEEAITKAGLDGKFQDWVKANFSDVIKSKRVHSYNKRTGDTKFLPYDLDTVARLMMKGGVRDNEGFNYGVGNIRAVAAKEFKSLADIRKHGDSLVTPAAMEAAKAESSHEFEDLVKELAPFYRYDANRFGYLDDASQAFKELITAPSKWNEAYKDVPDDLMKRVREFLVKLKNMPTEYFEGKIGRGVRLSELAGAVVPRDVSSDVRAILKKAGLRVVEYDEKNPDSRKAAVAAFSDQTFNLTPAVEPGQAKPAMKAESPVLAAIRQDMDEWFAKQKLRHWQALGLADVANMQAETYVARVQAAQDAQRAVMSGKVVDQMDRVLLTYTSAMDRLVPGLGSALQRLTHVKQRNAARDKAVVLALADKIKALPNANEVFLKFQVLGRADNRAGVEGLAKLHGFTAELAAAEMTLTQLRRDAIAAGVPVSRFWSQPADWSATDAFRADMANAKKAKPGRVGEAIERVLAAHGFTKNIDFYWPSKVFDREGLAAWFGRSRDARIVEAYRTKEAAAIKAGRAMTEEDLTELIGAMVNGGRQGKAGPGSLKARTIANEAINIEVMQFYHTAIEAALLHVESMRTHILQMDFFGKSVQMDERNDPGAGLPPIDLGQSARVLLASMAASNQIDPAKEEALRKLIVSRFEPTPANRVVNVIRALGYAMSLGQVYSGQTATLDALAIGLREDHVNPLNMVLGLIQAATGKSTLTLAEAGIDTYDMGEDFMSNRRWEDKMVRWVFKHNLLTQFSRLYAQAGLNQALKAAQRQARAGDMDAVKRKRLERLFGADGVARVMADLAAGRKTDDTLLYAFATVANYQPISPDQQSHFMRSSSTGKILFQFKSFLTVQFSGMRDDALNEIRSGEPKRVLNGTRFLVALAATLLMLGLPGDLLRAWLTGRTFILSDQVAARLLGLIGLSPYLVREGKRSGPSKVIAALAIPAVGGAADDLAKDVAEWEAVMTSKADVSYLSVLKKMRVWQNVPFIGKVYDDRFGHNADRNDKNREDIGWFVLTDPRADEKADAKNEATRKRLEEKYPNE